ncbi:hypothetical protein TBK1r_48240 [Stieleria magnilauensis]|uniref:Phosphoesterase n=1 Tax=Stieleria magnilauensis TaxID=2527963 RepID=A0ABX5XUV4_9BACT|nr:hypothetical protein TBK1r_48240 [Planctomycetes bacterium TBK1r]
MLRRLLNLIPSSWSREPIWLLAALIVVGGTWGFIELAEEVIEGDTQAFDEWAVRSLRRDIPRWTQPRLSWRALSHRRLGRMDRWHCLVAACLDHRE